MRPNCQQQRSSQAIRVKRCKDSAGQLSGSGVCSQVIPTGRVAEADTEEIDHG